MAEDIESKRPELLKWTESKGVTLTAVCRVAPTIERIWTITYSIPNNTMADVTIKGAPTRELDLRLEAVALCLLQARIEALDALHGEPERLCNVCGWKGPLPAGQHSEFWHCPKCGAEYPS